ncbi:MAG: hypothetical protein H6925_05640 [Holosporaceae bacterium]|nr:MAG: hypothetical protein H6925_05640 [Holosporaceae bacterium]
MDSDKRNLVFAMLASICIFEVIIISTSVHIWNGLKILHKKKHLQPNKLCLPYRSTPYLNHTKP